jgi:hypothetical protein
VHVLTRGSGDKPAHPSPVEKHLFPGSSSIAVRGRIFRVAVRFVPVLSAYATKMRVSLVRARMPLTLIQFRLIDVILSPADTLRLEEGA